MNKYAHKTCPEFDDVDAVLAWHRNEIDYLTQELQKRDKCSFMGPMRDCPTHGESEELKHLRAEVSAWRERLGDDYEYNPDVPYVVMKTPNAALTGGEAVRVEGTVMHRSNNDT